MKRITLLLMLLVASVSFAQIKKVEVAKVEKTEIGKITPGGLFAMKCEKSGNDYYFTYKDDTFKQINEEKTFVIKDVDNAFESLYSMIQEGFTTIPAEPIMLEFEDGYLWLSYRKFLGAPVIKFGHATSKTSEFASIGFSQEFTKKQIDKLFGKKK